MQALEWKINGIWAIACRLVQGAYAQSVDPQLRKSVGREVRKQRSPPIVWYQKETSTSGASAGLDAVFLVWCNEEIAPAKSQRFCALVDPLTWARGLFWPRPSQYFDTSGEGRCSINLVSIGL